MKASFPVIPLGEILSKSEEWIDLDPAQTYQQVTIKIWGHGVVQRNEVTGAEIAATRRFVVRPQQFILSRIDARNGALGIVPQALDGAVVSNDFPTFNLDTSRILPEYLGWMSKTHSFVELCKAASEGTTNRVRLQEDLFLSLQIPLPPLAEQRRIVARIEELAAKIEEARGLRRAAVVEGEMLLSAKSSEVFTKLEGYPKVAIANLGINGANPVQTGPFGAQLHREEFVDSGVPVLNVGNVTLRGLDTTYLDLVTPEKAKALARYELEADDLLFARTGATLGKVCLVPKKSAGWLMTGHLFRVRFDQQRCLPSFALIALRDARTIKSQVSEQVQGATRPGFNTTLLSRIKIPLPPLSEQHRIVAYLDSLQAKVDALKALQAETQAELDALLPSVLDKAFKGEL